MVKVENLSKTFSINGVQALRSMKLNVSQGEIHAVVGDNGAGKSTLMKILHGIIKEDEGLVEINGKTAMVSQHFHLIPEFSILENIIIGNEPRKYLFFTDLALARKQINVILEMYKFKLDLNTKVSNLSIGQKQLVEIIKAIYNDGDIIIFDEPTSVLNDLEAQKLRATLLSLKEHGKTIIIISHKIKDIQSVSDRFTIMRNGSFIDTVETSRVDIKTISKLMTGSETPLRIETNHRLGKSIFKLKEYGIDLREGEVIAFTGYGDCGIEELESKLEKISINNEALGFIPSDRLKKGVDVNSPLYINLGLTKLKNFSRWGIVFRKKMISWSQIIINKYKIQGSPRDHTGLLSGGNIQKTLIARVLEEKPKVLVLSSPTWGIDNESSKFIYKEVDNFRKNSHGIILISHDISEVLILADIINVMYKGKIIKTIKKDELISREKLGSLLAGIQ